MVKKIGITGGIGAGKSYICRIVEAMGYPVYYSDKESKRLTENNPQIKEQLIALIGKELYVHDKLDKNLLATKIFNNNELRVAVNAIIHPIVRKDFELWASKQDAKIVFNESALLIETNAYKTLDFIALVVADKKWRINQVVLRDKTTQQQVRQRMDKQYSDEQKKKYADFILFNDQRPLLIQIENMLKQIEFTEK